MRNVFSQSSKTFLLSALSIAITGCAGNALQSTLSISEPTHLNGELTTKSKVNVNDGSRYESFGLRLQQGEALRVQQSENLTTQLTLIDKNGRLIAGPGTNSLTLVPTQSGSYTLSVSGSTSTDYGPFKLDLKPISTRNSGALSAGDALAGYLSSKENSYQLTVSEPAIYSVTMASDEFDTQLALQGNGVSIDNDDYGDGTNSRLNVFLQPGSYEVRAGSIDESPKGGYTLDIDQRKIPADVQLINEGQLKSGQTLTGLVSMVPPTYTLELKRTSRVQIDMKSDELDALLTLTGNSVEYSDDDSGGNTNAKLTALLQPGRYKVQAQSLNSQAGLFELHYNETPVTESRLSALRPGQYAQGTHSSSRPGRATLIIQEAGNYVIDLASSNFDVLLELSGHGIDAQDDDSAGGTNARVSQYLEPGEYQIKVGSVDQGGGRFVISAYQEN